jgi:FkbM family methyltransferase
LEKKLIRFRNGVAVEIDYTQYNLLRDWFEDLHKRSFTICKEPNGYTIKNTKGQPEFDFKTQTVQTAKLFFDFLMYLYSKGWIIKRIDAQYILKKDGSTYSIEELPDNTYHLKSGELELFGPREILHVLLCECQEGLYEYNYNGKTVLDIGGFCGETAAYFSSKKAKKVIVYEPFKEHYHYIRTNAKLNNVNIEFHEAGIAEVDGSTLINYDDEGLSFSPNQKGGKQTTIRTENVAAVIRQSKADVAKIDCEGAEMSLTKVAPEILGLIPYYFIETHTKEIEKAVTAKFLDSGFRVARESVHLIDGISMHYFEKPCNSE